jgi:hypothetical protein
VVGHGGQCTDARRCGADRRSAEGRLGDLPVVDLECDPVLDVVLGEGELFVVLAPDAPRPPFPLGLGKGAAVIGVVVVDPPPRFTEPELSSPPPHAARPTVTAATHTSTRTDRTP